MLMDTFTVLQCLHKDEVYYNTKGLIGQRFDQVYQVQIMFTMAFCIVFAHLKELRI